MGWSTDDIFTFINPSITSPVPAPTYCTIFENEIYEVLEGGTSVSPSLNTVFL